MNFPVVLKNLGALLLVEALSLVLPLIIALSLHEGATMAFVVSILISASLGGGAYLGIKPKDNNIYYSDGLAIVSLGWILVSLIGALPAFFSGEIPSFIDSFFESSSGFSTTGASILNNIESLSKSLLFWRSFTHWLGGMGVLVFILAILPSSGAGAFRILAAESPGPQLDKIAPKLKETAKILYIIYIGITVIELVLLKWAGMSWFDSAIHTFGTVGTGGFSSYQASVAAFDSATIEWIITLFMFLCGVNFALYYLLLSGKSKSFFKNIELRFYTIMVLVAIVIIAIFIRNDYASVEEVLRKSAFQVVSIITTTGYATADYTLWPLMTNAILFFLMFIGGCAGSTSGGLKQIRILLLFKIVLRGVYKKIRPRSVQAITVQGTYIREDVLNELLTYFLLYVSIMVVSVLLIAVDNRDMATAISAVVATLNSIGPGLNEIGPAGNFAHFSDFSKVVFSFIMLVGRLEIFPMLLLFFPSFWKKANV